MRRYFRPRGRIVGSAPDDFPCSVLVNVRFIRIRVRVKVGFSDNTVRVRMSKWHFKKIGRKSGKIMLLDHN